MHIIRKPIWELPEMENYPDYYIDNLGNVWSTKGKKPKILNTSWMKEPGRYRAVCLVNTNKKHRTFLVHRLVGLAFMPHDNHKNLRLTHRNGIEYDNRAENLKWCVSGNEKMARKQKLGKRVNPLAYEFPLTKETFDRIESVVLAANIKGLPAATGKKFLNDIINNSIDEFVRQYGLHKIMKV